VIRDKIKLSDAIITEWFYLEILILACHGEYNLQIMRDIGC